MTIWIAKIDVMLKPTVNDPPGLAIRDALRQLGFGGVSSTRAGKHFEIPPRRIVHSLLNPAADHRRRGAPRPHAVQSMCETLLANPVVEQFEFTVTAADNPNKGA